MKEILPEYKCCKCSFEWEADGPYINTCPKCESIYYEWTNYAEWREAHMKDGH